jgi:hypothetical protein
MSAPATAKLAALIEEDRQKRAARPKHEAPTCFSCGREFTHKGPQGDDSGRFCSSRCREWFDAGNPASESPAVTVERVNRVPLRAWKVTAGPPGLEVGSGYYADILDRGLKRAKRIGKLSNDELIRPRRLCGRCGNPLPVWVKGKKVPATRKYCAGCAR